MIASFPPPPIALPLCHCPARSGPPCESCELQSYKERLGQRSPTRHGPDQIHTGLVPFEKLKPSGNVEEIQLGALDPALGGHIVIAWAGWELLGAVVLAAEQPGVSFTVGQRGVYMESK